MSEITPEDGEETVTAKVRHWVWWLALPGLLVAFFVGWASLSNLASEQAWEMVEKPALAQAQKVVVEYHTTTDDKDKDGAPDGHDIKEHATAAPATEVRANTAQIKVLTVTVEGLVTAVTQQVMQGNEDVCIEVGGSPYKDECLFIAGTTIISKLSLTDTKALKARRKVSKKIQKALGDSSP